jgi:phage shock protein A
MFARIQKLIKGFFSLFISKVEKANPRALLEAESQSLREAVALYNTNLAKQAAMVEKLKAREESLRRKVEQTTGRAKALLTSGDQKAAGRIALELKTLKTELSDLEGQVQQADTLYINLTKQRDVYVRDARKRIENIKIKMNKAELAEAQAELAEIASATAFDIAGSGDTLARLEENLDERVAQAAGKVRVAADQTSQGEWVMKAEEEEALEAQALAEFASAMGVQTPSPQATRYLPADKVRDLGPTQTN